jgi:hypothetical protein
MKEAPIAEAEDSPPQLRFLKVLVTVLAGTMILGLITIIALIVIRFPQAIGPRPVLPEGITLPEGSRAEAVTMGRGWIAVVTESDEILILDAESGEVRQRVTITPAE